MNTVKKMQSEDEPIIIFKIIRGGLYVEEKKAERIDDFWAFCHATFWTNEDFTQKEISHFKALIADHFEDCKTINKRFKELVERAVMAKQYITRKQNAYIAPPAEWLNIRCKWGLAGTQSWYNQVIEQRKTIPGYNDGIALLASAVLSYSKEPHIISVRMWRERLLSAKQYDLLPIYKNAILHIHFLSY